MKMEGELAEDTTAAQFRDQFFLHAVASQNPKLYDELYGDYDAPEEYDIPQTAEDVAALMAELAMVGVNLNVSPDEVRAPTEESNQDILAREFGVQAPKNPWNV